MKQWLFKRRVIRAITRKTAPTVRRPQPGETPLSPDEIWFGACRGLIPVPPMERRA